MKVITIGKYKKGNFYLDVEARFVALNLLSRVEFGIDYAVLPGEDEYTGKRGYYLYLQTKPKTGQHWKTRTFPRKRG